MKIVVCVKQVPDTAQERRLDPADKTLDREAVDGVLNELDEYAVEEALRLAEATGGEVTVLSMGPERARETVLKALQMGVDRGVLLLDDALAGSDAVATSYALAMALGTLEYDLVVFGSESTDARTSLVPAMVAERLGLPQLTYAAKVDLDGATVRIQRQTEDGYRVVEGTMPAVIAVVEKINEPRYPSFKGIMAAKKKPLDTLTVPEADIDPAMVGLAASTTTVDDFAARPPRSAGTITKDEGDGGSKLADFLTEQKFI
jgi:electron transfer flavoprotein beta subunit